MTTEEALIFLEQLLDTRSPLKDIQEIVFCQAWEGKTYPEIAHELGYSAEHIRDVGFRLWQTLSTCLGTKVTKSNLHSVFRQQLAMPALKPPEDAARNNPEDQLLLPAADLANRRSSSASSLEFPGMPLGLNSKFYIKRPPIEQHCFNVVLQSGALIRISGPKQMGKTSLLNRILYIAAQQGCKTVRLNFQQADQEALQEINLFLRWFCKSIAWKLNLDPQIEAYWDTDMGLAKSSCTRYFEEYLLPQYHSPLVLGLDEVDRIFAYPKLAQDFLPLLRVWHEEANESATWQRLRLIVVHATEMYLPLQVNQSPFNVGLPIRLTELTPTQVSELAACYGLTWSTEQTEQLMALVSGHPYLIQLGFYHLRRGDIHYQQLLTEAVHDTSIYNSHLRRLWEALVTNPQLLETIQQILRQPLKGVSPAIYQLQSMGLVNVRETGVSLACQLYQDYFNRRLKE